MQHFNLKFLVEFWCLLYTWESTTYIFMFMNLRVEAEEDQLNNHDSHYKKYKEYVEALAIAKNHFFLFVLCTKIKITSKSWTLHGGNCNNWVFSKLNLLCDFITLKSSTILLSRTGQVGWCNLLIWWRRKTAIFEECLWFWCQKHRDGVFCICCYV